MRVAQAAADAPINDPGGVACDKKSDKNMRHLPISGINS
jgi:hypothetical protein